MKKYFQHIGLAIFFILGFTAMKAQNFDSIVNRRILLRDSLDYLDKKLTINTTSNEFSPIAYKYGLLYISNKPIDGAKVSFNKIYWTADPKFNIIDKENSIVTSGVSVTKIIRTGKTDDFTAPTSNDNNILIRYKKLKTKWNKIEQSFSNFSTDQAFAYDDTSHLLVYAKKSNKLVGGKRHWELWQAVFIEGRLKQKKRIILDDKNANYLYPFITKKGNRLYFASDKKGSIGGYDIYYIDKIGGNWQRNAISLDTNINTKYDEIAPFLNGDSIYFSSNRVGGLGGFDIYSTTFANTINISNIGYPINSSEDEVSLKKIADEYYLSTNRAGNFDVLAVQYLPIIYSIKGLLTYKNDGTIVPNHKLYLKDIDANKIVDTIYTNSQALYSFNGKPNRNYEFTTLNGDSVFETNNYATYPNQKNFNYSISIGGRSPKQRTDSLQAIWTLAEKTRNDSIISHSIANKFIIHYGFNKSVITLREQKVLDSLLNKLHANPKMFIVVGAFTDCIGSYKYNYKLSVKRAKSVGRYLITHGLDKQRIVSNAYSKQYNITPCSTKFAKNRKNIQQNNRRAEIVLSETKLTNWAELESKRGNDFYAIVNASNVIPLKEKLEFKQKIKKDTIAKVVVKPVFKKDSVIAKVIPVLPKKDTIIKIAEKPAKNVDKVIIASSSNESTDDEMSKDEIIKALDSLAKLKREQERIVEYLTKRINKKPIDVFVSSDSVTVELYDNGIHDKDSVSVIYNNRIVVDRQELKVNKPIKFVLKVDKNKKNNELVMVAENLGIEPPNTAVMFITEKSGRRQQIMLSTDMTHNEVVYFIRIGKE